jgi:hypothetical protein
LPFTELVVDDDGNNAAAADDDDDEAVTGEALPDELISTCDVVVDADALVVELLLRQIANKSTSFPLVERNFLRMAMPLQISSDQQGPTLSTMEEDV